MKRVHVFLEGKVQGVFFRDSTRQEAGKLGVTGWVRNLPDGRVEAVFEGASKAVDEVVAWARSGPPQARVDDMDVQVEDPTGEFEGFEVRPTPRK